MIINILLITFIIVYIVDYSGIIFDLSKTIWQLTHPNKIYQYRQLGKPFGCSVCLSFWICSIYLLYAGQTIIISLAIGCLMALSTNIYKIIINVYNHLTNKYNGKNY